MKLNDNFPDWQRFEREANAALGIDATVTSGNKWYDKNDGTTRGHPLDNAFMIDADEKSTTHKTYSLSEDFLLSNKKRSTLAGKTFLLPLRFEHEDFHSDWIVISMDDFLSMTGIDVVNKAKSDTERLKSQLSDFKTKIAAIQDKIADIAESSDTELSAKLYDCVDGIDDALKSFS